MALASSTENGANYVQPHPIAADHPGGKTGDVATVLGRKLLTDNGITHSMNRFDNVWVNAVMEITLSVATVIRSGNHGALILTT